MVASRWTPAVRWPGQQVPDAELVVSCPFPPRLNPHLDRLAADTARWVTEQGMFAELPDAEHLTGQFLGYRGAEEHARMWPDAEYPGLWLASRLLTHMSCLDDFLDELWGPEQDDRAAPVVGLITDVLTGLATPATVAGEPLAAVLLALWDETRELAPDHWLERAAQVHLAYLKASMDERAQRWSASSVPTARREPRSAGSCCRPTAGHHAEWGRRSSV